MTEQSNGSLSPRTIWLLIAVAVAAMISVFASMTTSLAIRDLRASQHHVIDQLKALQEAVSSDRAGMKRLSDEVAALKATSPPSTPPPAPTTPKRGAR
jgi:hypothetical protein